MTLVNQKDAGAFLERRFAGLTAGKFSAVKSPTIWPILHGDIRFSLHFPRYSLILILEECEMEYLGLNYEFLYSKILYMCFPPGTVDHIVLKCKCVKLHTFNLLGWIDLIVQYDIGAVSCTLLRTGWITGRAITDIRRTKKQFYSMESTWEYFQSNTHLVQGNWCYKLLFMRSNWHHFSLRGKMRFKELIYRVVIIL